MFALSVIIYGALFCKSFTAEHQAVRRRQTIHSSTHATILFSIPEKDLTSPNTYYVKCSMPKIPRCHSASGRIFAVCQPACFSGSSDPQSAAQQKIHHMDWAGERAQTDEGSFKLHSRAHTFYFYLRFPIMDCNRCMSTDKHSVMMKYILSILGILCALCWTAAVRTLIVQYILFFAPAQVN